MLWCEDAVKRTGRWKVIQSRDTLRPDHAVLESSKMRRFRKIGKRPHTWTVCTQRHHTATAEIVHRFRIGIRPAGRLSFYRVCRKPPSGWKGSKILVAIATSEQYDVAESKRPVVLFPVEDVVFVDETAFAIWSLVDQQTDVDDTGFTNELPGRYLFAINQS